MPPDIRKLEDERDVAGLCLGLERQRDANWRRSAALALGRVGDAQAVEPLGRVLNDPDATVRLAAIESLGLLGAAAPLVEALRRGRGFEPEACVKALVKMGAQAIEPLAGVLQGSDVSAASHAAVALRRIGGEAVVEPLIGALRHPRAHVRKTAAQALAELGDRRAIEPLIGALADGDEGVREAAACATGKFGDHRGVDQLLVCTRDASSSVRTAASDALRKMGDPRAGDALKAIDDARVARGLVDTLLQAIPWAPSGPLRSRGNTDHRLRDSTMAAMARVGAPCIPPLVEELRRQRSVDSSELRLAIVDALGMIDDPGSVDALIHAMSDADLPIRCRAASALGRVGGDRGVQPLLGAIRDGDEALRFRAADALGALGGRAGVVDGLLVCLADANAGVRVAACCALAKIRDSRAIDALDGARGDPDPSVSEAALAGLVEARDPRALDELLRRLTSEDAQVVIGSCKMLGSLGDQRAMGPLVGMLGQGSMPVAAAALAAIGQAALDPTPLLVNALRHPVASVREKAAALLDKRGWTPDGDEEEALYLAAQPMPQKAGWNPDPDRPGI